MKTCKYCAEYFPKWSCGANRDTGECDCPKCQGICECEEPVTRASILDAVKKTICQDRQDVHGNPEDTHALIAGFWSDYLRATGWFVENKEGMISPQDVAVMMVLFKIARHAMNNKHADNLHDAIGYAAIAAELGN